MLTVALTDCSFVKKHIHTIGEASCCSHLSYCLKFCLHYVGNINIISKKYVHVLYITSYSPKPKTTFTWIALILKIVMFYVQDLQESKFGHDCFSHIHFHFIIQIFPQPVQSTLC
jgi:hypothetical protein